MLVRGTNDRLSDDQPEEPQAGLIGPPLETFAAGRTDAARPIWERVLEMASRFNDRATAEAAQARLQPGDTPGLR